MECDFYVLYGTQTNTAKFAAEELGRQAVKRFYTPKIMEIDEFPIMRLPTTQLVVFIVSTTGDGEVPETMKNAWKFLLRSDLPATSLKQLKFTVFGLGDSSYALYNATAKKLAKRLLNLGSELFHEVGLGDY
jgi:sulfite reductase alpha subunit-like flavoprotein